MSLENQRYMLGVTKMMLGGAIARISDWMNETNLVETGLVFFGLGSVTLMTALLKTKVSNPLTPVSKQTSADNQQQELVNHDLISSYIASETQIIVIWPKNNEQKIFGNSARFKEITNSDDPLNFSSWLRPERSQAIETAIARLKSDGSPFYMLLQSGRNHYIEAEGRILDNTAILRLRDVNSQRQEYFQLINEHENLKIEAIGLRAMLNTLSQPIWLRDRDGRISWVNEQYACAVETDVLAKVISQQIEFLDASLQQNVTSALKKGDVFQSRVPVIVSGQRRIFDIVETPLASGAIGYAIDVTDLETTRNDLQRQMASHVLTLDQLPTAVSIFDEKQRLVFCNKAYRKLWQLDDDFIQSNPTDGEILDRLRDARRLPEQADFKSWKNTLHEAYRSLETREVPWYLPGNRTLRVVVHPNPQGGVTYLFEDVTAQFILQSNFNSLSRVQSETLDSLKEGVAVFGMDGRLKLNNPAFEKIWDLDLTELSQQPHIDQIIFYTVKLFENSTIWTEIKSAIVGFSDTRHSQYFRMDRSNDSIVDCTLAPLPDGATLVTFIDVSASVHVERALKEKNDALEQAGQLRENFVHHVSYQLRSPLTNVIGFTELLTSGVAGSLTIKQSEYIDHVYQSSNALMAIIDDILDLASFDRGEINLERNPTNIEEVINAAIDGLKDRVDEHKIKLEIDISEEVDQFPVDAKRLRQIVFNLLSNSIGFSLDEQTIFISAKLLNSDLIISVRDNGRGIPSEIIDRVFDRFESYTVGSRHRGAGLGLSIVRTLVELHGGKVSIVSHPGNGTLVRCTFPYQEYCNEPIEAA